MPCLDGFNRDQRLYIEQQEIMHCGLNNGKREMSRMNHQTIYICEYAKSFLGLKGVVGKCSSMLGWVN